MKKVLAAVCSALVFALPSAHAQTAAPVNPAALAAVKELLVSMNYREMMYQSFAQLQQGMPDMMIQGASAAIGADTALSPEEKKAAIAEAVKKVPEMAKVFSETLRDPQMMDELIAETAPLYARHFSVAEIKQMAAFYKTPVGKKMLALTPQIMGESMQISQKIVMPRITAAIQKLTQAAQPADKVHP
jgi:hypothetical protein